ncbi:MAG: glycoside hydrolase family 2 protein, partial [Planctomycetota bacterium]
MQNINQVARLALVAIVALTLGGIAEARETRSLDGQWEILFDRQNEGREAGWIRSEVFAAHPQKRAIRVPSCWEEIEKDYEGVAFYRRTFEVPAQWAGKAVRMRFDAVNFMAEVWVNDQAVGMHEGGFTPFEFRVDQMLKPGETNVVTLRVAGPILLTNKRIEGVGQMETPQWRGAITGGIWQPVELIATDAVYVDDVFIEPRLADDSATLHITLENAGAKRRSARVEIEIRSAREPEKVVAAVAEPLELRPGSTRHRWKVSIPSAKRWSPDDPHLYRAQVTVVAGDEVSDRWTTRFGMREFTVRDGKFHLNGEPIYLKATFFEGLYPVRLAYPDSPEMAIREIRLAKGAGFNMIRPWRKPPPPMWLDLADEMGVMTVGSLAIECMGMPIESARLPGWVAGEVRESILRDRNRACVVQWELFNEIVRPVLGQMLHPMSMLARRLDPTRMILDESGGWAQGARLYLPYQWEPMLFNDIHEYPGPQINDVVYTKLLLTSAKTHEEMRKMGLGGRLPGRNVVPGLMTYF